MDVHRAAQIMSAAHGGQVVLSPSTISLLEPGTFELIDLGEHRLKDIEGAVSIFQLGDKRRAETRMSGRVSSAE
jgi:class 3 adenylate cyclase